MEIAIFETEEWEGAVCARLSPEYRLTCTREPLQAQGIEAFRPGVPPITNMIAAMNAARTDSLGSGCSLKSGASMTFCRGSGKPITTQDPVSWPPVKSVRMGPAGRASPAQLCDRCRRVSAMTCISAIRASRSARWPAGGRLDLAARTSAVAPEAFDACPMFISTSPAPGTRSSQLHSPQALGVADGADAQQRHRGSHRLDDLCEQRVGPDLLRPHAERAGRVNRPADDLVAGWLVGDRHRLAGDYGLVDGSAPLDDLAIHRNRRPGGSATLTEQVQEELE